MVNSAGLKSAGFYLKKKHRLTMTRKEKNSFLVFDSVDGFRSGWG
jgi:hypothetical protein